MNGWPSRTDTALTLIVALLSLHCGFNAKDEAAADASAERLIVCEPAARPAGGVLYAPPVVADDSSERELARALFTPHAISGDGHVVVGETIAPRTGTRVAATWSLDGDVVELPGPQGEAAGIRASCDGSVLLAQDGAGDVYRHEAGTTTLLFGGLSQGPILSMNPRGTEIIDGRGQRLDVDGHPTTVPRRWSSATGTLPLTAAADASVYHVSPDGSWIGSRSDGLFRYRPTTNTAEPLGDAPLAGPDTIVFARTGDAWIQSTGAELSSFWWWRVANDPVRVQCPGPCALKDLSSDGRVALLDDLRGNVVRSWLWTEGSGFMELTRVLQLSGLELGERTLRAVAMSDDGRAFAGQSYDADAPVGSTSFFYAVLPDGAYD